MLWMTWWPLVFGFALSGVVQSFVRRNSLTSSLGSDGFVATSRATFLGMVSSSCSYAASAMARSIFSKGTSWTNSMIFMIASTNLVVELGIVLYVLLGWQFLVAEFAGGLIMIVALRALLPMFFRSSRVAQIRQRLTESPTSSDDSQRMSMRQLDGWTRAARFAWGDVTMLRRELALGFIIAGYLAEDVPASWWHALFIQGHGGWSVLENVLVAPLVAIISFVCSVGNIPLAAALWSRGVAFGGVITFIFADLVTLPLLMIYRKFYGTANAVRILVTFWLTMSVAGLIVHGIFGVAHAVPVAHNSVVLTGTFDLGATLILNIVAFVVIGIGVWLARRPFTDTSTAVDPVCGMNVHTANAPARANFAGQTFYFCSPRCHDRFTNAPAEFVTTNDVKGNLSPLTRHDLDVPSDLGESKDA